MKSTEKILDIGLVVPRLFECSTFKNSLKQATPRKYFLQVVLMGLFFLFSNDLSAQIIPSGVYTEFATPLWWTNNTSNVVVNCDMREDLNTGLMLKAVVSSIDDPPFNINTCLHVDDGNTSVQICRWGGIEPDVAFVSGVNAVGVTCVQVIMAWRINSGVFLDIYNVTNIGSPGGITLTSALDPFPTPNAPTANVNILQIGLNTNSAPHIDVAIDPTQYGTNIDVHEFAVGWEDNGLLTYYLANMNAPGASIPVTMPTINNAISSDIAFYTETGSGGSNRHIAMSFGTTTGDLGVMEMDLNSGGATNTLLAAGVNPLYPRIAAIDEWNRTIFPWEVAAAISTSYPTGYEVWGYNNATPGGTNMSGLLSAVYGFSPETKAPCVTAGIGLTSLGGSGTVANIGNNQYTLGFYPWQFDSNYVRHVNKSTGVLINAANCYQVNDPGNPVNYNWDANESFAVATANNTGRNLLAAWFDGLTIKYKYSSGNTMTWKQLPQISQNSITKSDQFQVYDIKPPVNRTNNHNIKEAGTGIGIKR